MSAHIVPPRIYFAVFGTLIGLTFTTVLVNFIDLGPMNIVVAMTIAVTKMLLIMLFFMHVRYSSNLTKIFAGAGFFWLAVLISLTLSDFLSRNWIPVAGGW